MELIFLTHCDEVSWDCNSQRSSLSYLQTAAYHSFLSALLLPCRIQTLLSFQMKWLLPLPSAANSLPVFDYKQILPNLPVLELWVKIQTCSSHCIFMDAVAMSGIQLYPVRDFDQIVEIRAEKHEHLRGRNNVTSCRSPTREINTWQIKKELKKKRQLEFLRRRSVSPELCGMKSSARTKSSPNTPSIKHHSSSSKSGTFHTNIQSISTANGHRVMILTPNSSMTDGPSTSKLVNIISSDITKSVHPWVVSFHVYRKW